MQMEFPMAHNDAKLPTPGGEDPNVRYLAEHTDLSPKQARDLIREHGSDREKLMAIAKKMKAES